ncbi:MAG TPA: hypothetical protein VGO16_18820 [Pseudonocardiaceae bacterium]|jgi:hypothetical protein|nr:hypothetical protein [Pseudonocardiaceae bacterium]
MTTTAVIGLGILTWAVLAILVALFVARMIRLRDRQRPDCPESGAPTQGMSTQGTSAGDAEASRTPSRWRLRLRNKI